MKTTRIFLSLFFVFAVLQFTFAQDRPTASVKPEAKNITAIAATEKTVPVREVADASTTVTRKETAQKQVTQKTSEKPTEVAVIDKESETTPTETSAVVSSTSIEKENQVIEQIGNTSNTIQDADKQSTETAASNQSGSFSLKLMQEYKQITSQEPDRWPLFEIKGYTRLLTFAQKEAGTMKLRPEIEIGIERNITQKISLFSYSRISSENGKGFFGARYTLGLLKDPNKPDGRLILSGAPMIGVGTGEKPFNAGFIAKITIPDHVAGEFLVEAGGLQSFMRGTFTAELDIIPSNVGFFWQKEHNKPQILGPTVEYRLFNNKIKIQGALLIREEDKGFYFGAHYNF